MDNYEVVINGVKIAAKILEIEISEIRFFDKASRNKSINAMFLIDKNIIAFNKEWVNKATNINELLITCFHETRHVFQWEVINGKYNGDEVVSSKTKGVWRAEFNNYHSTTGNIDNDQEYLLQDIEIDAITFTYKLMSDYFSVKCTIPDLIKEQVNKKIKLMELN